MMGEDWQVVRGAIGLNEFNRAQGREFSYVKQHDMNFQFTSEENLQKQKKLSYSDVIPFPKITKDQHLAFTKSRKSVIDFATWFDVVLNEVSASGLDPLEKFANIFKMLSIRMRMSNIANSRLRSWQKMMDGQPAPSEVIGFMVSKSLVNSDNTLTHVSNFWIMANSEKDSQKFVDTQIKYGNIYDYQVYKVVAVIGNQYAYLDPLTSDLRERLYATEPSAGIGRATRGTNSLHYDFPFGVVNLPSIKFMTLPSVTKRITVVDKPPIYPNIDVIPFKNVSTKIMFNISSNTGEIKASPHILQRDDYAQFYINILNEGVQKTIGFDDNQGHPHNPTFLMNKVAEDPSIIAKGKITFKNDDPVTTFEVFRTDKHPTTMEDFKDKMIAKIEGTADNASYVDNILPNKKYYYVFRSEDIHYHVSNPTHIYEVELSTHNKAVRPIIKVVEPLGVVQERSDAKKSGGNLRQFIMLKPSITQRRLKMPETGKFSDMVSETEPGTVSDVSSETMQIVTQGGKSLFDKMFKLRVKSKNTGKEVDINFRFKLRKKDKRDLIVSDNPEGLC